MRQSGCVFFSFSPESGSPRMLSLMNKRFDQTHALKMTRHMSRIGIRTQACFIAGVPGETKNDRKQTLNFLRKLTMSGVDEIAVSIFTPIPGAVLGNSISGFSHYSELTHSPKWRSDYQEILLFRYRMYLKFLLILFILKPRKFIRVVYGVLTGYTQTKMEMSFRKIIIVNLSYLKNKRRFRIN